MPAGYTRTLLWDWREHVVFEQEDLAEVIGAALADVAGICDTTWYEDMAIAKVLLDAGYRKVPE